MDRLCALLVVSCFLFSGSYAVNPGFKSLTSLGAIQRVKDILIPIVQPYVQGMTVPDVSGSTDTPIGVTIDYTITNIVVSSFSFGQSSVTLIPGSGVQVQLTDSSATADMDWSYSASIVHGSGSAVDNLKMDLSLVLAVGEVSGKPSITVQSLSISITSIDITVHGGASWFYQVIVDIFKSKIKSIMESSLQSQLASVINQLANYYLRKSPTNYPINKNLMIDYSFTTPPFLQPSFSESDHTGQFVWSDPKIVCPFNPGPLPDDLSGSPLTFIFSQDMGSCIASILFQLDSLSGLITPKMVPSNSPVQLNTSSHNMKVVLPQLYEMYPDQALNVKVWANTAPTVFIDSSTNYIDITIDGSAEVFVVNATLLPAFLLDITLVLQAKVGFTGTNVTANIVNIKHNTTLDLSWIGNIDDMTGVDEMVTLFISLGIQPMVNKIINAGMPIPRIEGVQFLSANVLYGNGYLKVGSDFSYQPNAAPTPHSILTPNMMAVN